MFENVGRKLRVLAVVVMVIVIVSSILSGLFLIFSKIEGGLLLGLITIGGGILGTWISLLPLYALGQIADNTDYLVRKAVGATSSTIRPTTTQPITPQMNAPTSQTTPAHASASAPVQRCPHCGERVRKKVCEYCGKENDYFN